MRPRGLPAGRDAAPLLRGHIPQALGEVPVVPAQVGDHALALPVDLVLGCLHHPGGARARSNTASTSSTRTLRACVIPPPGRGACRSPLTSATMTAPSRPMIICER